MANEKQNKPYEHEIEIKGVTKSYEKKDGSFLALSEVNLNIDRNEFICVVGPSGCGKTTLLNLILGITAKKNITEKKH